LSQIKAQMRRGALSKQIVPQQTHAEKAAKNEETG
jgi:hypothetical protein